MTNRILYITIFSIIILLILSCSSSPRYGMPIAVVSENLKSHVSNLTSIEPTRNHINNFSRIKASQYIKKEFKKNGCTGIEQQQYIIDKEIHENIICSFGKKELPAVVVGAHYDTHGDTPGADDNASGVAGLIELARLIADLNPSLKNRIDLVAYDTEEPPYYKTDSMGSYIHAAFMNKNNFKVKVMLSLEMIGYYSELKDSQHYPFWAMGLVFPSKGNFILVTGKNRALVKHVAGCIKSTKAVEVETLVYGIELSDHINYLKFGYPAVMVTDTAYYRNNNYHKRTDLPASLDYNKMAEVVKGVYMAIVNLE